MPINDRNVHQCTWRLSTPDSCQKNCSFIQTGSIFTMFSYECSWNIQTNSTELQFLWLLTPVNNEELETAKRGQNTCNSRDLNCKVKVILWTTILIQVSSHLYLLVGTGCSMINPPPFTILTNCNFTAFVWNLIEEK